MSLIVIVFTNLHCKLGRYHKWIFVAQMYNVKTGKLRCGNAPCHETIFTSMVEN